jgi:hypothetical protein
MKWTGKEEKGKEKEKQIRKKSNSSDKIPAVAYHRTSSLCD